MNIDAIRSSNVKQLSGADLEDEDLSGQNLRVSTWQAHGSLVRISADRS